VPEFGTPPAGAAGAPETGGEDTQQEA
jgi:hypothetical protein